MFLKFRKYYTNLFKLHIDLGQCENVYLYFIFKVRPIAKFCFLLINMSLTCQEKWRLDSEIEDWGEIEDYILHYPDFLVVVLFSIALVFRGGSLDQRLCRWWESCIFDPRSALCQPPKTVRVCMLAAHVSCHVPWCQLTLPRSKPSLIRKYGGYC